MVKEDGKLDRALFLVLLIDFIRVADKPWDSQVSVAARRERLWLLHLAEVKAAESWGGPFPGSG